MSIIALYTFSKSEKQIAELFDEYSLIERDANSLKNIESALEHYSENRVDDQLFNIVFNNTVINADSFYESQYDYVAEQEQRIADFLDSVTYVRVENTQAYMFTADDVRRTLTDRHLFIKYNTIEEERQIAEQLATVINECRKEKYRRYEDSADIIELFSKHTERDTYHLLESYSETYSTKSQILAEYTHTKLVLRYLQALSILDIDAVHDYKYLVLGDIS